MKKENKFSKLLIILAIALFCGSLAGCKASDCNCPKFSVKEILK